MSLDHSKLDHVGDERLYFSAIFLGLFALLVLCGGSSSMRWTGKSRLLGEGRAGTWSRAGFSGLLPDASEKAGEGRRKRRRKVFKGRDSLIKALRAGEGSGKGLARGAA